MSNGTTTTETPQPPPQTEAVKFLKGRLGLGLLDSALNALRLERQAALNRRLVRKQQDGTLGKPDTAEAVEEDPLQIIIGDTQVTTQQAPTPTLQPSTQKSPSNLLPWILALALGGSGLAYSFLQKTQVSPVVDPLRYNLDFVDGNTEPKTP